MLNSSAGFARCAIVASFLLAPGSAMAGGGVFHVPGDHPTIQQALDAAVDGDAIIVAPGTYHEAIDFLGKSVHVHSSDGPAKTVIDATPLPQPVSVVTFASGEGQGAVLDGFTITGGSGSPAPNTLHGGGILIFGSYPTIRNCVIAGNSAEWGGGISVRVKSVAWIENCHIIGNSAGTGGGALVSLNSAAHFFDCIFEGNTAQAVGGGLASSISPALITLDGCTFTANTAGAGGGAHIGTPAWITNCAFHDNSAEGIAADGGALRAAGPFINLFQTTFAGNAAQRHGGAIFHAAGFMEAVECAFTGNSATMNGGAMHSAGATIIACSFDENAASRGAGIYGSAMLVISGAFTNNSTSIGGSGIYNISPGNAAVTGSVFSGNTTFGSGGAIHNATGASITDSEFIGNSAEAGGAIRSSSGTVVLKDSTIAENVALAGGGVSNGPSVNAFFENVIFCGNVLDHAAGPWSDAGGNEFHDACETPSIPGDLTGDGSVGVADLLILLAAWGPCDDCAPGGCPADLTSDCNVGVGDLLILLANWG